MLSSVFIYNMAWEAGIPAAGAAASWDTDLTLHTRAHTHVRAHTHTHRDAACVEYLRSPARADIKRTGFL